MYFFQIRFGTYVYFVSIQMIQDDIIENNWLNIYFSTLLFGSIPSLFDRLKIIKLYIKKL